MKLILTLLLALSSQIAFGDQSLMLGADFEWGQVLNSQFKVEICSLNKKICLPVEGAVGQIVPVEKLSDILGAHPELVEDDRLLLKWGYWEKTICCGVATQPWLEANVEIVATQLKSQNVTTVIFPDGTYFSALPCIVPNPIRKANGLGLFYIGSEVFAMSEVITPRGFVGHPIGNVAVSCSASAP